MIDVNGLACIFDKAAMSFHNEEHRVAVRFEKKTGDYFGKLQDMPMELFNEISRIKDAGKKSR